MNSRALYPLLIPVFAALALAPMLALGPGGADVFFHTHWVREFSAQFWQGNVYPRWLPDMYGGCGYPAFYFYPPLPYWIASAFAFADAAGNGWVPILCSAFLGMLLAGLFCHRWLSGFLKPQAAILGTLVYLAAPYTVLLPNLFLAYSEFFTAVWLPLMLHYARLLGRGDRKAFVWLGAVMALQLLSSLPGSIIVLPAVILYGLWNMLLHKQGAALFQLLAALLLAAGLTSFYTLPMMHYLPSVKVGSDPAFWQGMFSPRAFFLSLAPDSLKTHSLQFILGWSAVGMMLAGVWCISRLKGARGRMKEAGFWAVLCMGLFFLLFPASVWLWEHLPLVKIIRYPWRLFLLLTPALALFAALLVENRPTTRIGIYAALLLMFFSLELAASHRWNFPLPPKEDQSTSVMIEKAIHEEQWERAYYLLNIVPFHEFLPSRVDLSVFTRERLAEFAQLCREPAALVGGAAEIGIERWKAGDISLSVKASRPSEIRVGQWHFPAWKAEGAQLKPSADALLHISLPAGKHEVRLFLDRRYETTMAFTSLFFLLLWLLAAWFREPETA